VIKQGVVHTAANVDPSWIGLNGQALFQQKAGCPVVLLNDADAAGVAEVTFGAGKGQPGVVLLITLGTGIGSALFLDGRLVPNTELGHLEIRGKDATRNWDILRSGVRMRSSAHRTGSVKRRAGDGTNTPST
jgi:polyphosphate glucokinase